MIKTKHIIVSIILGLSLVGCSNQDTTTATKVASVQGVQITGVAVSNDGRIFANAPLWREDVPFSVVEISKKDGSYKPYPTEEMNNWKQGTPYRADQFIAVQSVVSHGGKLYVLDTRNPLFIGLRDKPRIFIIDLEKDQVEKVISIGFNAVKRNSYVNDLRVDDKLNKIYLTDSGEAGLIVVDIEKGTSKRVLDSHQSTLAETNGLSIDGEWWPNVVHSDGIALDRVNDVLYFHSLTGYSLYSISTEHLNKGGKTAEENVQLVAKTSAPDGMIFDEDGNLYYADLENHKIMKRNPDGEVSVFLEGDLVRWADSFSIHNGYLYYTNSRIHEAGDQVDELDFTICKKRL